MSPERVERTLSRLAYEIVERNRGATDIEIFGIERRGAAVAQALARRISAIEDRRLAAHGLDVRPYRDDRDRSMPLTPRPNGEVDVTDRAVILVDDVLYTGRSIRAALDALIDYGRPQRIQLAVLVDRGHRELPIRADFVGKNVPTARQDEVLVQLEETDGIDQVLTTERRD